MVGTSSDRPPWLTRRADSAVMGASLGLFACAPVPSPTDDVDYVHKDVFADATVVEEPPAHPGFVPGGFYPTWQVGVRWEVGVYQVNNDILAQLSSSPPHWLPRTVGSFTTFEVESISPQGTVTLRTEQRTGRGELEDLVRIAVDRTGQLTKIDPAPGYTGLRANAPHGHAMGKLDLRSRIPVWPLFPLEPGVRESADGEWTQVVTAEGDARLVTIVFEDRSEHGNGRIAAITQRWEVGRPFWSYQITNGEDCWGHGALLSLEGEHLIDAVSEYAIRYPGADDDERFADPRGTSLP